MASSISCACAHCGAKYRLPAEAQGRSARCKKCGEKFTVPANRSLEDSVLAWLAEPEAADEAAPQQPRVERIPDQPAGADFAARSRGIIRMKDQPPSAQAPK